MPYKEEYWSTKAEAWTRQEPIEGFGVVEAVRKFVSIKIVGLQVKNALDIFSGSNPAAYLPPSITPEMITAIDGSQKMLSLNPAKNKIQHIIGDGELPLNGNSYELITVFFGWRYLDRLCLPSDNITPECKSLLKQLYGLLTRRGKLLIMDFSSTFDRTNGLLRFKEDATLAAIKQVGFSNSQICELLTSKDEEGHDNYRVLGIEGSRSG